MLRRSVCALLAPRVVRAACVCRRQLSSKTVELEGTLRHFGVQRLRPWLATALRDAGFKEPTAVQAAAMPVVARHDDVVIHSETGSGKTLAFLVPVLSRLDPGKPMQVLLLAPSRELALQLASQIDRLLTMDSPLKMSLVVGGLSASDTADGSALEAQRQLSSKRAEIIVATPTAMRRVLQVDERGDAAGGASAMAGGEAGQLLLQLANNLETIVIDEVRRFTRHTRHTRHCHARHTRHARHTTWTLPGSPTAAAAHKTSLAFYFSSLLPTRAGRRGAAKAKAEGAGVLPKGRLGERDPGGAGRRA